MVWSTDFIDNIKKLFQDPMQSIIGLHILYGTPITGAEKAIQVGYLNSGVNSKVVTSQYIDIDCGVIKVNKYFGDVRDYNPYTKIQVFLPFIGIVDLDTNECIDSDISIKYRIDVLTGSCLCQVSFKRTDFNSVLYTFAGNCSFSVFKSFIFVKNELFPCTLFFKYVSPFCIGLTNLFAIFST